MFIVLHRYTLLVIRIIAGEFRSRKLKSPAGDDVTRPVASRVKESIFNILREQFEEATVLDLFAGIGTMGLEALSRGASRVLMVEQNGSTFQILQDNIASLNVGDRVVAMQGDALSPLVIQRAPKPVDVVFVDPPYALMRNEATRAAILNQIERCGMIMNPHGFVILRSPALGDEVDLSIAGFDGPELHDYGPDMQVRLYMPAAEPEQSVPRDGSDDV